MKPVQWGKLIGHDLRRSWSRLLGVSLAVAASVGIIVVLVSVSTGVKSNVIDPLLPQLPLEMIKVEPKTMSLGLFAVDAGSLGGGMTENTLEKLRKLDGVVQVFGVLGTRVPLRAEGGEGIIGKRLRTDIFATGVSPSLVEDEIGEGQVFEDPGPEGPIPVIVARRLLELYNSTVAVALGKPKLSERLAIGIQFKIQIGVSFSGGLADARKVQVRDAMIVGFSDHASLVGVTVPEATMRSWNQRFGKASPLVGAWVQVEDPSWAGPVARRIEQAGLRVDPTPKIVGAALGIGAALLAVFSGLLLLLSGFAIAQVFFLLVAERRTELAILRAIGAEKMTLFKMVLLEASLVGLTGSVLGVVGGCLLALGLNQAVKAFLPQLPFQPESLVVFPVSLLGLAAALGIVAALVGAVIPALRASGAEPARALRS